MNIKGRKPTTDKRRQTSSRNGQSKNPPGNPAQHKKRVNKSRPLDKKQSSRKVEFSINLPSLPVLRWSNLRNRLHSLDTKQKTILGGATLLLVAGALIVFGPFNESNNELASDSDGSVASSQLNQLERSTPEYNTLTPGGQDDSSIDWFRVSPKGTDPVYVFVDEINGAPIRVSQQQLPPNFQENTTSELERTARESGVLEKITIEGDAAYIGAVADGRRSVILIKNDLLVLIDATGGFSTDQLTSYISSLE